MGEVTVTVGDIDLRLSIEEAERVTLELTAALYEARHGVGS